MLQWLACLLCIQKGLRKPRNTGGTVNLQLRFELGTPKHEIQVITFTLRYQVSPMTG